MSIEDDLREVILHKDAALQRIEYERRKLKQETLQYKERVAQVERILYDMTQAGTLVIKLKELIDKLQNKGGCS